MPTIPAVFGNLIVSRRPGESLHIGSHIEVVILAVRFDVVRFEVVAREIPSTAPLSSTTAELVSCRVNQSVCVAASVEISLIMIRGQQARIAIKAPRDVPVLRGELR